VYIYHPTLPDFTSQNKVRVDPRYTPTLRWIYPNLVADLIQGNGRWIYGYNTGFACILQAAPAALPILLERPTKVIIIFVGNIFFTYEFIKGCKVGAKILNKFSESKY
jgi:hypothetical protein